MKIDVIIQILLDAIDNDTIDIVCDRSSNYDVERDRYKIRQWWVAGYLVEELKRDPEYYRSQVQGQ